MKTITTNSTWLNGYLKRGHITLNLTEEEYEEFKNLSKDEQLIWIGDDAEFIIKDFELNDYGEFTDFNVY